MGLVSSLLYGEIRERGGLLYFSKQVFGERESGSRK